MRREGLAKTAVTIGLLVAAGDVPVKGHAAYVANVPRQVNLAQLTEILNREKSKRDDEVAKVLDNLQLTERLSSKKLAALNAELPGTKSRNALMVVSDESEFLEPPLEETPKIATPDAAEQRGLMSLVLEYLKTTLPKLPNFIAQRTTISFESIRTEDERAGRATAKNIPPRRTGETRVTVLYRDQREVVRPADGSPSMAQVSGLTTWGTFGPILSTVILDASHGKMIWSHWEDGSAGPIAIFRYQVSEEASHYDVSTERFANEGQDDLISHRTAYHGEIGVDAATGAIRRLIIQADPTSLLERADIMVEYGPVDIGGRQYTCPLRSVSISTGHPSGFYGLVGFGVGEMREVTRLNDVVFNEYHVFRSDMRVLP
jgi:hypothetical protein